MWIANHQDETNDMSGKTSQSDYLLDLRAQNQSYEDLAAYFAFYGLGRREDDWRWTTGEIDERSGDAELFSSAGRGAADGQAV